MNLFPGNLIYWDLFTLNQGNHTLVPVVLHELSPHDPSHDARH